MTRSASCGDRKRRSRLARSSSATCAATRDSSSVFHFGQLVGLPSDGVVVALDPRQRRHPGQQLALVERLGDEVVGSRLEGAEPLFASAGRDHHDRKEFGRRVGPDPAADLVAVHLRHQDVEQDEVDVLGLEQRERFRPDDAVSTRCPRGVRTASRSRRLAGWSSTASTVTGHVHQSAPRRGRPRSGRAAPAR